MIKRFAFFVVCAVSFSAHAQTVSSVDCTGTVAGHATHPSTGPNIWLILIDDADYEQYRYLGSAAASTPNLDFILANGCVFENGYVPMSTCRPSIASLLTGKYPDEHQIKNNDIDAVLSPSGLFTTTLLNAGYFTFLGGKFFEGRHGATPAAYGFRCYEKAGPQQDGANLATAFVRTGQDRFLRLVEDSPRKWFAFWAPLLPHTPFDAPKKYRDRVNTSAIVIPPAVTPQNTEACRAEMRDYLANLAWLDDAIGEGLNRLVSNGQLENTLIVTLADNGWSSGCVSKQSPYEKGNRTHISFTWIGTIEPKVRDDLVSSVDIPPTVMQLIGERVPSTFSGHSLVANIVGDDPPLRLAISGVNYSLYPFPNEPPNAATTRVGVWSRRDQYKYIRFDVPVSPGTLLCCLRWQHRFVPVYSLPAGTEQLFDLDNDPFETTNLANDPSMAEVLRQLRTDTTRR